MKNDFGGGGKTLYSRFDSYIYFSCDKPTFDFFNWKRRQKEKRILLEINYSLFERNISNEHNSITVGQRLRNHLWRRKKGTKYKIKNYTRFFASYLRVRKITFASISRVEIYQQSQNHFLEEKKILEHTSRHYVVILCLFAWNRITTLFIVYDKRTLNLTKQVLVPYCNSITTTSLLY